MKYKIEKNTVQETLILPLYSRKLCTELYPNPVSYTHLRSLPAAVSARMSAALPQKMPVQRMPVHLPGKAAAILP